MTLHGNVTTVFIKAPVRPSFWPNNFILVKGDKAKSRSHRHSWIFIYWDHWWDSFDLSIRVFLQTEDWGKGAGRWIVEAQTQRKGMDVKVLQQILMKVWMMNLLVDHHRPPHTLPLDYLQKEEQNFAMQSHNATITQLSQGEYTDIYYYNYYKANHAWQRTDAQQKLHLHSVHIFLLAVFSILLHVRRDVQQPHNQVSWQVFPSLWLPEQAKLQ